MSGSLSPAVAYAAGALTILSPCVLPLIPIVLGSAAQRHRWGPLALALGLVASFTLTGFAIATIGASAGLNPTTIRLWSAVLLLIVGVVLVVPRLQALFEHAAGPLANWAGERQARLEQFGLAGQAGIGVLLGLVWSPCVGPTLGAATVLAAQGKDLGQVALVMGAFALGIATVLLILALFAQTLMARWRGRLMEAGTRGRRVLGVLIVLVGVLIITGTDHQLEAVIIGVLPDWVTDLSTSL
ncbi:cytochrome c biogenesis CcdA family protein [Dyella nitratireducens]|uniref:Cytochrome C biogenesis protein CcdA n=1 Tax=Dyella nitratireducens TaxID=1849580 RepID=A0ABQ1FMB6_9GAMM|nr:cytochrome c biogenesis CcdA family protein [Dyella nitratireducens]GGA22001.1 cytochrome C biogenesis protein CcdA [Dyella nitratireducens]GLQ44171.1 cytochrome C biogenesis protein CcdA [Dyella nitratireducens]